MMNIRTLLARVGLGLSLLVVISPFAAQAEEQPIAPASPESDDNFDYSEVTIRDLLKERLAQLEQEQKQRGEAVTEGAEAEEPLSPECAAYAEQPNADVGDVLNAGCEPTLAQMSALMDNPVGNVAMLFTQFDSAQLQNPANSDTTAFKHTYTGIAQFPKGLNKDWNLINRIVWTLPSQPLSQAKIDDFRPTQQQSYGLGPDGSILPPAGSPGFPVDIFGGRTTGLGDLYYIGLFSPKKPIKLANGSNLVWGAGFDAGFPTASSEILGTGKWSAGPSALLVYLGKKWKVGFLAQHYWDFAGDPDRDSVNLTNIQTLYYYSLDSVTSIGAGPNVIANWQQDGGNRWTVPIGIGINRTFQFGKIPVRIGIEAHYSAFRPADVVGTRWNFRLYFIPSAPSALFAWMK